jgi:hypothetical protein
LRTNESLGLNGIEMRPMTESAKLIFAGCVRVVNMDEN